MGRLARRLRKARPHSRPSLLWGRVGWVTFALGLIGWIVNEFTVDLPPVHFTMYVVMLAGGYLGFRFIYTFSVPHW